MQKTKSLIFLAICLLMVCSITLSYATGPITLYAHSEGLPIDFYALSTTACDGPEDKIELISAESDLVPLGNSSAIQLSSINSRISKLNNATWAFTYYCKVNKTNVVTLLVNVILCDVDGVLKETLGEEVAETTLLSGTANQNKTGTFAFAYDEGSIDWLPTDYLKIVWYANKTEAVALNVTLWLDVIAAPTKITGIEYDVYPSSHYWDPTVRTIWQIVLPLIFLTGVVVAFISHRKEQLGAHETIIMIIAFLLLAILTPIALNTLYGA